MAPRKTAVYGIAPEEHLSKLEVDTGGAAFVFFTSRRDKDVIMTFFPREQVENLIEQLLAWVDEGDKRMIL